MIVSKVTSLKEVADCIDLYIKDGAARYLPIDRERAVNNLKEKVRMQRYVRVCREPAGEILAWIYADLAAVLHTDGLLFTQHYFGSRVHGLKAVRCIETLHDDMLNYARIHTKADYCMSGCSPADTRQTFVRILGKCGWTVHSFLATKKIDRYS